MKIINFGNIIENGAGQLEFHYFRIDGQDTDMPTEELLLTLVIERMQAELEQIRNKNAANRLDNDRA